MNSDTLGNLPWANGNTQGYGTLSSTTENGAQIAPASDNSSGQTAPSNGAPSGGMTSDGTSSGNAPTGGAPADGSTGQGMPSGGQTGQAAPTTGGDNASTETQAETQDETSAETSAETQADTTAPPAPPDTGTDNLQSAPQAGTNGSAETGENGIPNWNQGNTNSGTIGSLTYTDSGTAGGGSIIANSGGVITLAVCLALMVAAIFFAAIYKRR